MTKSFKLAWCLTGVALMFNLAVLIEDITVPLWHLLPIPIMGLAIVGMCIVINIRTMRRNRA